MMKLNLSDSEWKLMNRLWSDAPMTITELTAALRDETGWSKNTVITMLSVWRAKAPCGMRKAPVPNGTSPPWHGEDAAMAETENFLSKVYGGRLGLMMRAMVDSQALTEDDIAELAAILERAGGEHT